MTEIISLKKKNGKMFFPKTHTQAVVDENGNPLSTLLASKQDELTLDDKPRSGSNNFVTSGSIYDAINIPFANHGTSDTTLSLTPNVFHVWGEVTSLNLGLATPSDQTVLNRYWIQFTSGYTPTTLSLPDTVRWVEQFVVESGKIYQILILNNVAHVLGAYLPTQIISAQFISRVTGGGIHIANPKASFKGIRGNTLVWNQLCVSGAEEATMGESATLISKNFGGTTIPEGHLVYIAASVKLTSDFEGSERAAYNKVTLTRGGNVYGGYVSYVSIAKDGAYHRVSGIVTNANSTNNALGLQCTGKTAGDVSWKDAVCLDLTQMFGSGNEPTLAEFEAMFPLDYYDNNAGSLLNNNATSLVSKDSENNTLDTITLNIPTLTGKLNGEGDSVVIFADGMKSAGGAYDEIYKENGVWKAAKRVGNVDLGTLTWRSIASGNHTRFYTLSLSGVIKRPSTDDDGGDCLMPRFSRGSLPLNIVDTYFIYRGTGSFNIVSDSYDSISAFAAALSGIYLNYGLATPLVYVLDDELQETLNVTTGGMESILPINESIPVTSPAIIPIEYTVLD